MEGKLPGTWMQAHGRQESGRLDLLVRYLWDALRAGSGDAGPASPVGMRSAESSPEIPTA